MNNAMLFLRTHRKKLIIAANITFILCTAVLTVMTGTLHSEIIMSALGDSEMAVALCVVVITAFVVAGVSVLTFKCGFIENTYGRLRKNPKIGQLIIIFLAILCAERFISNFYANAYEFNTVASEIRNWWFHLPYAYGLVAAPFPFTPPRILLSAVLLVPGTVFYVYFLVMLVDVFRRVFSTMTDSEKKFLVIGSVIAALYIFALYGLSNAYYTPYFDPPGNTEGGRYYEYEVLYNADSGHLTTHNVFGNVFYRYNDLRQPFYSIFTIPFDVIAKMISPTSWVFPMQIIQLILLLLSTVLLSRMVAGEKQRLFFSLLVMCTFPYLVFSAIVEQYIFVVFWLILLINTNVEKTNGSLWFTASAGSLTTSAIAFPLLIRSKKTWFADILRGGAVYLLIAAISGRIVYLIIFEVSNECFEEQIGLQDAAILSSHHDTAAK